MTHSAIALETVRASGCAAAAPSTPEPLTVPQTSHHPSAPQHAGCNQPTLQSENRCFPPVPGDGKAAEQANMATQSAIAREAARASGCAMATPSTHDPSTVQQTCHHRSECHRTIRIPPALHEESCCVPPSQDGGKAAEQANMATPSVIARETVRATGCATSSPKVAEPLLAPPPLLCARPRAGGRRPSAHSLSSHCRRPRLSPCRCCSRPEQRPPPAGHPAHAPQAVMPRPPAEQRTLRGTPHGTRAGITRRPMGGPPPDRNRTLSWPRARKVEPRGRWAVLARHHAVAGRR